MRRIALEAKEQPEIVKNAPQQTPVGRPDDTKAALEPVLTYQQMKK